MYLRDKGTNVRILQILQSVPILENLKNGTFLGTKKKLVNVWAWVIFL